jgi:hypothetical protein
MGLLSMQTKQKVVEIRGSLEGKHSGFAAFSMLFGLVGFSCFVFSPFFSFIRI